MVVFLTINSRQVVFVALMSDLQLAQITTVSLLAQFTTQLHGEYQHTKTSDTLSTAEKYKHYSQIYDKCWKLTLKWGTSVTDKPPTRVNNQEQVLRRLTLRRLGELTNKCLKHKLQ